MIGKKTERPQLKTGFDDISQTKKDRIYSSVVWLHNENTKYNRQIYNLFDLLGDLGGVTEIIMLSFGFFLYSVSEHSFYLTAIKKLFYARTMVDGVFRTDKGGDEKYLDKTLVPEDTPRSIKNELEKHRFI